MIRWDIRSLEFLDNYNFKFHKKIVAMIVDGNYLNEVAKRKTLYFNWHVYKKDIVNAVEIFKKNNCTFELMHCVSTYPMKAED